MEIHLDALGKQLKAHREKRALTQEYVAAKVGVSISYLSNLERGNKGLRLSTFIRLADLYEVSCDELLKDSLRRKDIIENEVLLSKIEKLNDSDKALIDNMVEFLLSNK